MFIESRSIKFVLIAGFAIAVADIGGHLPPQPMPAPFIYAAGGPGPIDVMRLRPAEPMAEDEAANLRTVCTVFATLRGGEDCVAALAALKLEDAR